MQPTLFCGKTQRLDWLDRIEGLLFRSLTALFQPHSTASLSLTFWQQVSTQVHCHPCVSEGYSMSRTDTPPDASASSQSHWARARGILRGTQGPLAPRGGLPVRQLREDNGGRSIYGSVPQLP